MSKLKLNTTMSIDGFVAGPSQSEQDPLGVSGMDLHRWLVDLAVFRDTHGEGAVKSTPARRSPRASSRASGGQHHGPQHVRRLPWDGDGERASRHHQGAEGGAISIPTFSRWVGG